MPQQEAEQSARRTVVIGFYGPTLDRGQGTARWDSWRPSVALCNHEDLLVHRFELLIDGKHETRAKALARDIGSVSPETDVVLHQVSCRDPWDFEDMYGALHDFAAAYPFDPEHEDYLIHITTGTHVAQICLFLLTEERYLPGRLLQTSPPPRKKSSDPGSYRIIDLDLSKYDQIASRFEGRRRDGLSTLKSGIPTRNVRFNDLIERLERVVLSSTAPVLLTGPTGSGKSLLARRIYDLKHGRHLLTGRFVEVNCATLRGEQAMAALFGHVKGAFTGAAAHRDGLLKSADKGMLFLDEIGELGLDEQTLLLRAIEEKRFLPVGSDTEVTSDFQLIAGTNRDLIAATRDGTFRDDLLARINVWTFELPSLRERREDIEPNLDFELELVSRQLGRKVTMNKEARATFLDFATSFHAQWLANFRDLNAVVMRMATLSSGGRITVDDVLDQTKVLTDRWSEIRPPVKYKMREERIYFTEPRTSYDSCRPVNEGGEPFEAIRRLLGDDAITRFDRVDLVQLEEVIRVCRHARTASDAGRQLYAASRRRRTSTNDGDRLRKYLARFGLDWQQVSAVENMRNKTQPPYGHDG